MRKIGHHTTSFIALLMLILVIPACSSGSVEEGDSNLDLEMPAPALSSPTYVLIKESESLNLESLDKTRQLQLRGELVDGHVEIQRILASSLSVEELHAQVQIVLDRYEQNPFAFVIEQRTSVLMLQKILSSSIDMHGAEIQPIVAHYAQILLDQHNPSAFVLAPALEALREYWTPEKIRYASSIAISSYEDYERTEAKRIAKRGTSLESMPEEGRMAKMAQDTQSANAIARLRKLASSGI